MSEATHDMIAATLTVRLAVAVPFRMFGHNVVGR
jgi:hypothetical protein